MSLPPAFNNRPTNMPIYSLIAAVSIIGLSFIGLIFIPNQASSPALFTLLGLVTTSVPGLLAAGYAERTSRDVRNGVLEEKVTAGATKALVDTGVTQVVANAEPNSTVVMQALIKLLNENTAAVQTNTTATQVNTERSVKE